MMTPDPLAARVQALIAQWRNATMVRRPPMLRGLQAPADAEGWESMTADERAVARNCANALDAALAAAREPEVEK